MYYLTGMYVMNEYEVDMPICELIEVSRYL
jgi:hypothetical protein